MIEYHRELINDEVRTSAYRRAILKTVKPGDVVVDIGCGSGILSYFACEAGASRVYSIDSGHMADVTGLLARHLGFSDRITVFHDVSTAVELPERVDVLVTETMGVLGYDEQILGSVIDARKRMLKSGAAIVPQRLALFAVPVELPAVYDRHIAWWSEPRYGLDLSPIRFFASNSLIFVRHRKEDELAQPAAILDLDLTTVDTTLARGKVTFTARRAGNLHGFVIWFQASLAEGIELTTLAHREASLTQWTEGFFPLEVPIAVAEGTPVALDLETDNGFAWRWRGRAGSEEFDQTTWLAKPPCSASK